jgi:PAS domain S-box-containing protein
MRKIKVALPTKVESLRLAASSASAQVSAPPESGAAPKEIDFTETINGMVRRRLQAALNVVGLALVCLAVGELYLKPGWSGTLTMSITVAAIAVALRLVLAATQLPNRWAQPMTAFVAGLITINSLIHLYVDSSPAFFMPLLIIAAGAGFFLLSTSWLNLVLAVEMGAWICLIAWKGPLLHSPWLPYGLGLLVAGALSYYVHRHQLQNCQRQLWMEVEEENQGKTVAEAFQRAQEAEEKFLQLASATFEATAIHQKGRILEANAIMAAMFGYEPQELMGCQLLNLLDPSSHGMVSDAMLLGSLKPIETLGCRKDGTKFALEIFCKSLNSLKGPAMVTAFRDISERQAAHQNLLAEQQRLRQQYQRQADLAELDWAIDQPTQLFPLLDRIVQTATNHLPAPDGACVLLWEPADNRFLVGATTIDKHIARSQVPAACSQPNTAIHWVFTHRESLVISEVGNDALNLRQLFAKSEIAAYAALPLISENQVLGLLIVIDSQPREFKPDALTFLNTLASRCAAAMIKVQLYERLRQANQLLEKQSAELERKNLELNQARETIDARLTALQHQCQALQSQNAELALAQESVKAAHRAQSEFLANISPELRTPMNGILGMTAMLQSSALTPEQHDYLDTLNTSAESLLQVINNALEFATNDPAKTALHPVDFDLLGTMNELVASLAPDAGRKDLELCCWIPEDLPTAVRGDVDRLSQVVRHLLHNAIKFTERGDVLLSIGRESETPEELMLRFTIQDTGVGLPPDRLAQLFDSPAPTGAANLHQPASHGSSLRHTRNLIELMQGQMGAESTPGQGSIFWFTVRLEKRADTPPTPAFNPTVLAGESLLIVDDSSTNRLMLQQTATAAQMRVQMAATGEEAYNLLRQESLSGRLFSVILIDQHMPGMDGLTLARTLHADPAFKRLRLVLMVKANQPLDPHLVNGLRIAACLTKPIYAGELTPCLASILNK